MTEQPATTDHPVKRTRATKKAAETVDAVENATVAEAEAPAENVITAPVKETSKAPSIIQNDNGVIGSPHAERVFDKTPAPEPEEDLSKTAVWSDKNVRWSGVGALIKGYNIVTNNNEGCSYSDS
jgi:hypothetical protein